MVGNATSREKNLTCGPLIVLPNVAAFLQPYVALIDLKFFEKLAVLAMFIRYAIGYSSWLLIRNACAE